MPINLTRSLLKKYSEVFPVGSAGLQTPRILSERRTRQLKNLDSFALFSGVPKEPGTEHLWFHNSTQLYQEPALLYLTGINQEAITLVLNPFGPEKEVLFVPTASSDKQFWNGISIGLPEQSPETSGKKGELQALTGIACVKPQKDFPAYLRLLVESTKKHWCYCYFHERMLPSKNTPQVVKTDHHWAFLRKTRTLARAYWKQHNIRRSKKEFVLRSCVDLHLHQRFPLDEFQIKDSRRAISITGRAFKDLLPKLTSFRTEGELAAFLEYRLTLKSPFGLSFPTITAAGTNALYLHYRKNDSNLPKKRLVLLDFGIRYGTMHADISRTIPIGGNFNPLQLILYKIVLAALKHMRRLAKPGVTIRELNAKTWHFLEKKLTVDFFSLGGMAKRQYTGYPHGVSHLIGMQVHEGDAFRAYQDAPLQPGWLISSEPGLYGTFSIVLQGKKWSEDIGIRLEDNLLIRENGCLNLSSSIPIEPEELERRITQVH